jgi:hypothetical protein
MDRSTLLEALTEVAEHLASQGVTARIYVVGGAAMALAYDAERSTRDIDAVIVDHHTAVTAAVREIASRHGWPSTWLNEQASSYAPIMPDPASRLVFDHPALRVLAASPDRLLAMKARAARVVDGNDIVRLAALTECVTPADVIEVVRRVFPGEPVSERTIKVLYDVLGGGPTNG